MSPLVKWCAGAAFVAALLWGTAAQQAEAQRPKKYNVVNGQKWFEHVWTPHDNQAKGDGLGPLFNERSCIACHFLGGIGGAGPNKNNVALLTFMVPAIIPNLDRLQADLVALHPGFEAGTTVILHRYSNNQPPYAAFSAKLLGLKSPTEDDPIPVAVTPGTIAGEEIDGPIKTIPIHGKTFKLSVRNTTPMFGAGLIDAISVREIERVAALEKNENPNVHGVFVGRFGWRGQIMNLRDFNRGACATEMGLGVSSQSQAVDPGDAPGAAPAEAKADLTDLQCEEMNAFVARLPAPRRLWPTDPVELRKVKLGEKHFSESGCAVCHRETLGRVRGLYSDLLMHDMGGQLYDPAPAPAKAIESTIGMVRMYYGGERLGVASTEVRLYQRNQAWRTPPLWGLRDSGPYLHDGRAETVDEAILAHGGEAADSLEKYRQLSPTDRELLLAFLNTLVAPDPASLPKLLEPQAQAAANLPQAHVADVAARPQR